MSKPEFLLSSLLIFFLTKWLSENFYLVHLGKKGVGGGYLPSDLFWLWRSELELSLSKQMSPLWNLYEHPFHKNHIYHQGITHNACLRAPGGFADTGIFLLSDSWPIFNKISKFLSHTFGKKGRGGRLAVFRSLLTHPTPGPWELVYWTIFKRNVYLKIFIWCIGGKTGGGGLAILWSLLNSEKVK